MKVKECDICQRPVVHEENDYCLLCQEDLSIIEEGLEVEEQEACYE